MGKSISIECRKARKKFEGKFTKKDCTGFLPDPKDHDVFTLYTDGVERLAFGKFSRASKGKNKYVHSQTPKQLGVTRNFFKGMINCTYDLCDYLREWNEDRVKDTLGLI